MAVTTRPPGTSRDGYNTKVLSIIFLPAGEAWFAAYTMGLEPPVSRAMVTMLVWPSFLNMDAKVAYYPG